MKKFIDNGGSAFPLPAVFNEGLGVHIQEYGMTIRDYFAGNAMQAMIANMNTESGHRSIVGVEKFAKYAYEYADAMLAERDK